MVLDFGENILLDEIMYWRVEIIFGNSWGCIGESCRHIFIGDGKACAWSFHLRLEEGNDSAGFQAQARPSSSHEERAMWGRPQPVNREMLGCKQLLGNDMIVLHVLEREKTSILWRICLKYWGPFLEAESSISPQLGNMISIGNL